MSDHPAPSEGPDKTEGAGGSMKRLFVVLVLLVMMLGLRALKAEDLDGGDPMTLAAIGFVVLAAFAVAELLGRIGLPKVTGYIISGVVLGPYVANVLSIEVVGEMQMFNTLAVGLIALTAGLELELKALGRLAKTLTGTIVGKVGIAAPLVCGALVAIELTMHPLGMQDSSAVIGLGLIFGAFALGTSPAISLAIVSESRAKGRLSDMVLGVAVLKDVVVVVALAIAIAAAKSMTGGDGDGGEAHGMGTVLLHVGEEIGLSVLAGSLLGGLLILYLRFIKAEMLLFVAAMVLVVAEITAVLHLELLLVFIVGGFVVRNFSDYEHDLLHPLEMVSLPVFVVFFTNAGAKIDLLATWEVLPVALALFVTRAIGYFASAKLGNWFGDEPKAVRDNAWFAYLPQAGVILGLVGLASEKLPDLAPQIQTLGMAVVALNLAAGPIALRFALGRAGEIPSEDEDASEANEDTPEAAQTPRPDDEIVEDPKLRARLDQLQTALTTQTLAAADAWLGPWAALRRRALVALTRDERDELDAFADKLLDEEDVDAAVARLAAAFEAGTAELQRLDANLEVALEDHWLAPSEGETRLERARRVRRRLALRRGERRIPLRLAAREAWEPRLAGAVLALFRATCRAEAQLAAIVRDHLDGDLDTEQLAARLGQAVDDTQREARAELERALDDAGRRLRRHAARLDSPKVTRRSLDFAEAAATVQVELDALRDEAALWPAVRDACWRTAATAARIHGLDARIGEDRHALSQEFADAGRVVSEELAAVRRRLAELRESFPAPASPGDAPKPFDDARREILAARSRNLLPAPSARRLRHVGHRLRRLGGARATQQALRELFFPEVTVTRAPAPGPNLAESSLADRPFADPSASVSALMIDAALAAESEGPGLVDAEPHEVALVGLDELALAEAPARVAPHEVDAREIVNGEIVGHLLPFVERCTEKAAELVVRTLREPVTIAGDLELLLEVTRSGEPSSLEAVRVGLARAEATLDELERASETGLRELEQALSGEFDELSPRLSAALAAAGARSAVSDRSAGKRGGIRRWLAQTRTLGVDTWTATIARGRAIAASLTRDYRLRSGQVRPSAREIADILREAGATELPADYLALLSTEAIRDPRFFVGHRELLNQIVDAERLWERGAEQNALLVVGGSGSGKSSLLNVAALKVAAREVLSLRHHLQNGVIASLASELRSPTHEQAVRRRLLDRRRVIVIDDVEHMLPPDGRALDELDTLLSLIAATRETCFWIVSASREFEALVEPITPLRLGFAELIELPAASPDELAQVLLQRHRASGLELGFPTTLGLHRLGVEPRPEATSRRAPPSSVGEREFFRALAKACRGSLREAMIQWRGLATLHDDGEHLSFARYPRPRSLPFLRQLPTSSLALLALVVRFGPRSPAELSAALAVEPATLARWLHFLVTADLLEHDDELVYCPDPVVDLVTAELIDLAIFHDAS